MRWRAWPRCCSMRPAPDFSDYQRINRAIFDTNGDRTLAEIVAEGDRAQADFVELIRSLPEEDLEQPGRFGDQEKRINRSTDSG